MLTKNKIHNLTAPLKSTVKSSLLKSLNAMCVFLGLTVVCKARWLPKGEISQHQESGNMIQNGRKFKDDDAGEKLDLAKRKLLVTLLNYYGVLQTYCRDSDMGAIRSRHVLSWSWEKINHTIGIKSLLVN